MSNLNADEKWIKGFKSLIKNYEEENIKLKKLLKECEELMGDGTTYMHIDVYQRRKKDVMNSINQVLGE